MGKRLTRQDLLDRVNKFKARRGGPPLTMKNFQRAVSIARHNKLMKAETINRLAKGR